VTLAGAELPYRILFDQMNEGAVTLTSNGLIVHCNRRFAEIVQTPLARVIGMPLRRFVSPADAATLEAMRKAATRESTRGDVQFRAGDGSLVPVAVSFAPLHQEGSADVNGVVGVVTDITERRRAEAERARLVERMITAQEEERRRIARELHDEIGQSLTALLVGLRSIERSPTVERAVELAQQLRETTAQTLDEVGRLWQGLHPGVLDDLGLAAAVTRHAQEFARLHEIAVDVRTHGLEADGLSPVLRATVYRVLQEALTNVAQHARARAASVWLSREAGTVQLRVQDDGAGFQPGNGGRLGLRGMRERAALLGGSVEVESQPRAGTTIIAQFPVRDE
jgi:PAS domain S-box-containing protein